MNLIWRLLPVGLLLAAVSGPTRADDKPTIFHGAGIVTGLDAESGAITINAKAIPGFRDAMEMNSHAEPPSLAANLSKGDSVEFDVDARTMAVVAIKKTAKP